MNNIVETVKKELLKYTIQSYQKDGYDFWDDHIKYVFQNSKMLAAKRGADVEICELAALFHDMSMPAEFGPREKHEIYSAKMARSLLIDMRYPEEKIELIEKCILHHRSSKDTTRNTLEEEIIADADVMAHFDNIPSLFSLVYRKMQLPVSEGREYVKKKLAKDYKKLSSTAKEEMKERFEAIMKVLFPSFPE